MFDGFAVTLVGGLPVLFLTFFAAIVSWRVIAVAIYAFDVTCTAVLGCSAAVGAASATSLGGRHCEINGGWRGVAVDGCVCREVGD